MIWIELSKNVDTFELNLQLLDQQISIAPGPIFSFSLKCFRFLCLSRTCEWNDRTERTLTSIDHEI